MVGIDEVDPDGGVPNPSLSLAGLANLDVLPSKDFGATRLVDADRFRHVVLLAVPTSPGRFSSILVLIEDLEALGLRKFIDPDPDVMVDHARDGNPFLVAVSVARELVIIAVEDHLDASRSASNRRADDNLADQIIIQRGDVGLKGLDLPLESLAPGVARSRSSRPASWMIGKSSCAKLTIFGT